MADKIACDCPTDWCRFEPDNGSEYCPDLKDDQCCQYHDEREVEQFRALETIAQALLEVRHAQEAGANWYTRGASGLYQQVAMWVRKGEDAVTKLRTSLQEGEGL